jgi:hypothetical protein
MPLSKESIEALSDMVENRLSIMTIGDRDDLRERITLQQALRELHADTKSPTDLLKQYVVIPRRGRRRKVSDMINESERA